MTPAPLIALIDGPLAADTPGLAARTDICDVHPRAAESPAALHAAHMAAAIRANAPAARFLGFSIFPGRLSASLAAVAEALHRAACSEAQIVHCSFGQPHYSPLLAGAAAAVLQAGKLLVASAPARGAPVCPAACSGVQSVQGDARCAPGQWSLLNLPGAQYGACPGTAGAAVRGASLAAAHFTGLLARARISGGGKAVLQPPAFIGRERITLPPPSGPLAQGTPSAPRRPPAPPPGPADLFRSPHTDK
ncbi:peptidase S8 and S53 subtilisin kexin sedolisin [Leisingera methylohalidivorans]|uniref:Peptidase S8 and S53 subtilisin kexin sedolisin n=1 Tax=Leisingera methylohalidivorans DSM 14336 TaxID=999552 RepID=V9VTK8_9RHOB|nr:peptidase S8 and S53 subtilisin kexin sedolisin [Leisingera methylohalidivorans]AHD02076.1 peptidase S8 and S53 subtilisin kexin sedolisin [Leisingera methylohalidivorans DSM 14336]